MIAILSRHWWMFLLRGLVAVLFGVVTFFWPLLTLAVLVLWFGAFIFLDGLFTLIFALRSIKTRAYWWLFLLEGLAGMGVGVITFLKPGFTILVFVYLLAAWAILAGVFRVIAAILLRREISGEWALALSGLLGILLGALLFLFPSSGAVAMMWMIGIYALLAGIFQIALGIRLRRFQRMERRQREARG